MGAEQIVEDYDIICFAKSIKQTFEQRHFSLGETKTQNE